MVSICLISFHSSHYNDPVLHAANGNFLLRYNARRLLDLTALTSSTSDTTAMNETNYITNVYIFFFFIQPITIVNKKCYAGADCTEGQNERVN
jgi:hypothetical protein